MTCEISMITQEELSILNKFQPGKYIVVINVELINGEEIYSLAFNSLNTKPKQLNDEVLFSQNGRRREFKSLDTVKNYLSRHCNNASKIEVKFPKPEDFPYLKDILITLM